jgi:hypothetical protein
MVKKSPHLLWDQCIHYSILKSSPLELISSLLVQIHMLIIYLFKIHWLKLAIVTEVILQTNLICMQMPPVLP